LGRRLWLSMAKKIGNASANWITRMTAIADQLTADNLGKMIGLSML